MDRPPADPASACRTGPVLDFDDPIIQAEREGYVSPGRADQPFDKRQITYGTVSGRPLEGTLYLPREPASQPRPAVVYVHGGGWSAGDRGQFARHAAVLTSLDFVGLCISYRLSGEAQYPACVQDAKCAVRWVRQHAEPLGVDATRIGMLGSSAGAHIAAVVATTGQADPYESTGGWTDQPTHVQAAVLFNGIFYLPPGRADTLASEALVRLLGGSYEQMPDRYRDASPIERVSPGTPPCLLIHGDADRVASVDQSRRWADRLTRAGVACELRVVPGMGHGQGNQPPYVRQTLDWTIQFWRRRLMARP